MKKIIVIYLDLESLCTIKYTVCAYGLIEAIETVRRENDYRILVLSASYEDKQVIVDEFILSSIIED